MNRVVLFVIVWGIFIFVMLFFGVMFDLLLFRNNHPIMPVIPYFVYSPWVPEILALVPAFFVTRQITKSEK